MKRKQGEQITPIQLVNLQNETLNIPSEKIVHLQFRRFSSCPICNLHLQTFVSRKNELDDANIHEVVFFHSSRQLMLPIQKQMPFDIIADPDKRFYQRFGVETSLRSVLSLKAMSKAIQGHRQMKAPITKAENGRLGLPADFLISPAGELLALHYGKHADDQWSVEDLLSLSKEYTLI